MMSKDAYYFSHDSNAKDDEKIIALRMRHGWHGYGLYWAIIELLRDSSDYTMQTHYERIAYALRDENERIESIINDFDLFSINNGCFWSVSLKNRMELKDVKSQKAREAANKRWSKANDDANAMQTHSDSNASKVKEKKVKETNIPSIEEFTNYSKAISIYKPSFDFEIKSKYESWVADGWKDGHGNKIKNWKTKIKNTMVHFKGVSNPNTKHIFI